MKKQLAFLLIIIFGCTHLLAQKVRSKSFDLDSLPASVTSQWLYHAGDNPAWADTAFNDNNWQHVDPTQERPFLPKTVNTAIGWFRLTVNVSPALRGKAVALTVNQHGAAEIYFNGVLIRTLGRVSADFAKEQTRRSVGEPITLELSEAPRQYIAVRYSFNPSEPMIGNGYPVINARFSSVESAWDAFFSEVDFYTTRSWVSGSFMLLAILQLAIYFFNRERKVNLYLSLYAFMQMITLSDGLLSPLFQSGGFETFIAVTFNIAAPLDFVFLVMMTYDFFGYKPGRNFVVLAVLCVPVIIVQFIGENFRNEHILAAYNIINYLEIIRVSVKALKKKKAGAGLFLTGIILSLTFFLLFNIDNFTDLQPFLLLNFEVALAFLIPAIILSVLLAREFAQNLISLRQRLAEVELLSIQNLQQEAEKQQILSKQNEMLEQKVAERTAELRSSLINLKAAQNQLIQSEKMASLGELTAGIAHEIQNPLNFVNNFSDVSIELLEELKEEEEKGNKEDVIAIADDLTQNLEKIRHHGKRADAIVKGMLQHSRTSSGQKEATNLNALADEYLRLAYHGLRAKNKNFNAELITHFDQNIPKAHVLPQDIGRVLLNLFNNAFYAVNQKVAIAGPDYKPTVEVSTSQADGKIIISVKDNGPGIPEAIKDKIMQPFFTTKPTGEGTGLGLSLSYDIVVKGHGGSIEIDSVEGRGSEFTISLPVS